VAWSGSTNSQGMRWPIESSTSATRAFARGIAEKIYRPNVYAHLAKGQSGPLKQDRRRPNSKH